MDLALRYTVCTIGILFHYDLFFTAIAEKLDGSKRDQSIHTQHDTNQLSHKAQSNATSPIVTERTITTVYQSETTGANQFTKQNYSTHHQEGLLSLPTLPDPPSISYEGTSESRYPSMLPDYSNLAPSHLGSNNDSRNNSRHLGTRKEDEVRDNKGNACKPSSLTKNDRVTLYLSTKEYSITSQPVSRSKEDSSMSRFRLTEEQYSQSTSNSRKINRSAAATTSLERNILTKNSDNHPAYTATLRSCDPSTATPRSCDPSPATPRSCDPSTATPRSCDPSPLESEVMIASSSPFLLVRR